ncbi:MAG TPA: hypothetical protein VE994_05750 [Terriglobales bacterium]|nr:hypothetical protein [Terriglobales bacterium]
MKPMKWFAPIFALGLALAPVARAQFGSGIVFDPTQSVHAIQQIEQGFQQLQTAEQIYTTAYTTMNQVIAAYNLAYQMSRMPQDLAARYQSNFAMWTNFSSASVPDTYGNTSAWINALDLGNPARAVSAYNSAVIPIESYPGGALSQQDANTQAAIQNQYASSEIGQATLTNSLSTLGTIRADSQTFQQKLANLESDTYSTDPTQQTSNALLGKINSATMIQIHSQQDTNQILAAEAAQQVLDEKEQLDERNRLINQSIYFQQNFPTLIESMTSGVSDAIHSVSLSTTGH